MSEASETDSRSVVELYLIHPVHDGEVAAPPESEEALWWKPRKASSDEILCWIGCEPQADGDLCGG